MREGQCPKCGHNRVAVSSYSLYLGQGFSGPTLDLYACAGCHYTEQYIRESVENRVAVLDAWRWVTPDKGPFR